MRPLVVVPLHPRLNDASRRLKGLERVLPDTLLFQAPKKPFDHSILLRRIRRDELLLPAIVTTGLSRAPTLKDQAVIASQHGSLDRTPRPELLEAGGFDRALGLLRATRKANS